MSSTAGKVIKCRAAVAWAPKTPLVIEEVEVAPPKANEVRIKMVATGVCHTDSSFLNGIFVRGVRFPIILGHEGAGIVESVGEGVTKFQPGDHVIPLYVPQCFECRVCTADRTNLCEKIKGTQQQCVMPDGTSRFTCKGQTVYHSMGTSTFSEYTVVADVSLAKIDKKAPLDKVCLIGCGISTGYGAAQRAAKVEKGSICGVWGLGGIGLAAVLGCKNAGASRVFGIDINPKKREIAEKFGCTDFINPLDYPGQNIEEVLLEKTGGGFDYTFECIGNINTMRTAFMSSNPSWGVNILIGISSYEKELTLFPVDIVCGRTLKGTFFGSYRGYDDVPKLVQDYLEKKILIDEMISHTMRLDSINDALHYMHSGDSIRSVVLY